MYVCIATQEPLVEVGTQTPIGVGVGVVLVIILFVIVISQSRKKGAPVDDLDGNSSDVTVEDKQDSSGSSEKVKNKRGKGYHKGLSKSRGFLASTMERLFGASVDEAILEELEETLLMADVGIQTTTQIVEQVRQAANKEDDLRVVLRRELLATMDKDVPLKVTEDRPYVIMMVGVNGSGKTTTIGKLAHRYIQEGKSVMVAAGDTFRAGAIEQLQVWAERVGADFISSEPGADPASVMYNALDAARARKIDVLLCDTAGRLQAHGALMAELGKVMKVMKKKMPEAPHECLLVLDSTIGQNALSQAKGFTEATPLTGVVLTKLDGTAKGGVVLAVKRELGIPVRLIGLGEGVDDLTDFNRELFVDALLDNNESIDQDGE